MKIIKGFALCSVAAVLAATGQNVLAHTGIRDSIVLEGTGNLGSVGAYGSPGVIANSTLTSPTLGTAGTPATVGIASPTLYTSFTVTHGINDNVVLGINWPLISFSAVFPNSPVPALSVVTDLTNNTTKADLSADIVGVTAGSGFTTLGASGINANIDGNYIVEFTKTSQTIRGWHSYNSPHAYYPSPSYTHSTAVSFPGAGKPGNITFPQVNQEPISQTVEKPFKITVPKFKSTSCAKSLEIRFAVASWSKKGEKTKVADPINGWDNVDVWFGQNAYVAGKVIGLTANAGTVTPGIKFNSHHLPNASTKAVKPPAPDNGVGPDFWPTITVIRDLVANPLPGACGAGVALAVQPTPEDIDNRLPIPSGSFVSFAHPEFAGQNNGVDILSGAHGLKHYPAYTALSATGQLE